MPTIKPRAGERLRRQQRMGQRYRDVRDRLGLTLREVGAHFDRSHNWLHAVEKGDNGLDAIDALELADFYDVPLLYFVADHFDQRRPQWPQTLGEWIALAGGDRELAQRHWDLEHDKAS